MSSQGQSRMGGKHVGKVVRALYGTRDAPLSWLTVVKNGMKEMGFSECKVTNGVFTHPERDIRVVVHVDDFPLSGEHHQLSWFQDQMPKKYELKVQTVGWSQGDNRELQFLGRVIRLTQTGIELEGDDKHVELMTKEGDMDYCNPVATPYAKPATARGSVTAPPKEARDMTSADATCYRRAAARINYVALDRPDLSFASRIASSSMSSPKEGDDQLADQAHHPIPERKAQSGYQVSVPK